MARAQGHEAAPDIAAPAHALHTVLLRAEEYAPAGQGVHVPVGLDRYQPGTHAHAVAVVTRGPVERDVEPDGQAEHPGAPATRKREGGGVSTALYIFC